MKMTGHIEITIIGFTQSRGVELVEVEKHFVCEERRIPLNTNGLKLLKVGDSIIIKNADIDLFIDKVSTEGS